MKFIKIIAAVSALISVFMMTSFTYSGNEEDFLSDFEDILPNGDISLSEDGLLSSVGADSLLSDLFSALSDGISEALSFFILLFGISVIMMLSETASPLENKAFSQHVRASVSCISALLIFSRLGAVFLNVKEGIETLSDFFGAALPIFTGILYAGGNINSATSGAFNMNLTLSVISYINTNLLLPLVAALFALALLSGIDTGGISAIAKGIKSAFMWILGITAAILVGAFSMQSVISGAADSAYLRAAKYAASGMIPIVGSTVSSALGTLAGGLSYVKSTVGIAAVFAILSISLSPLVTLLLYRFAFSVIISFSEFLGASDGAKSFTAYRTAVDSLISVYVMVTVVYISETVVFMKCGVSVFG